MATKRTTRPRTIGTMLREARERKGEGGKPMPKTEAVRELGLGGRQTYYHWEDDYATPDLSNAERLAEFTGEPLEDVVQAILEAHGISLRVNEDRTVGAKLTGSGTVRARSTGAIPGLCSWAVREPDLSVPVRLDTWTHDRILRIPRDGDDEASKPMTRVPLP